MDTPKSDNVVFVAELSELPDMLSWVRAKASLAGFSHSARHKIEVSLEELLVNIISYAHADVAGTVDLTAHWIVDDYIEYTIKDRGQAFNPAKHNALIDPAVPVEERAVGGVGIALVKAFMDEMQYKREGVYNILTLRKYCKTK
ncbi:MAG: ATP-binding protein [Chlamydiales bacterium]|nr:ATP-binding protein [Chlamydiales bacterium]